MFSLKPFERGTHVIVLCEHLYKYRAFLLRGYNTFMQNLSLSWYQSNWHFGFRLLDIFLFLSLRDCTLCCNNFVFPIHNFSASLGPPLPLYLLTATKAQNWYWPLLCSLLLLIPSIWGCRGISRIYIDK